MDDTERTNTLNAWVRSHLEQATPAQWHIYAARSNYDDNDGHIRWLIDNPLLDRGTAVLLYWYLGAAYHCNHAGEKDVPEFQRAGYALLRLLEGRILENFYVNSNIYFDPADSEGGSPSEIVASQVRREIPSDLIEPSPGKEWVDVNPDGYDDGLPSELAEKIHALFQDD
jgi:hypothetical protein